MKKNLIAIHPHWEEDDFFLRVAQIAKQFRQDDVHSIGLWFEDAANFACVLIACFQENITVLLPPNLLVENQQWIADNTTLFLDDNKFKKYGCLQHITEIQPFDPTVSQAKICMKTSGSSGEAKVLVKTADILWREAIEVGKFLPFQQNTLSVIGTVSIQHFYGLTYRVLIPLWHRLQGKQWLLGREQVIYPERLIMNSQDEIETLWITSPALLSRMNLDMLKSADCHLAGIISSGGALDEQLGLAIQQATHSPVMEGYGSTETGCIAFRQPTQLWKPLFDIKLGINDEGALWVESSRTEGREQTADAVDLYKEGFHLLGRIDRIVKLGDKRLSLVTIEQCLQRSELIMDAYVAQHPEKQRIVAWLALNEIGISFIRENGRKALIEELKLNLSLSHELFAHPRYWRFTTELPRSAQSKIQRSDFEAVCYNELREPIWYENQTEDNSITFKGVVPLDLIYFKGHFSNFPLVPGVVELQWAVEKSQEFLGRNFEIERIDNLKYQAFLRPNDYVELTLIWDQDKHRMKFTLRNAESLCASGLIIERLC